MSLALAIALFVTGVHFLLDSIVWTFLNYDDHSNKKFLKPVLTCHICMTSIWGTLGYFLIADSYSLPGFIITIGMSAAFNMFIYNLITKLER